MSFPDFNNSLRGGLASVRAMKTLNMIEKDELLQYGNTLTLKSLYPNSIELQIVKLAMHVFNDRTVDGLQQLGPKKEIDNWESTATFIKMIH